MTATQSTIGTLALVGGRPFTDGCDFDPLLLERSGADVVTVIPTAAAYEHPERLVEAATEHFSARGAKVDPLMALRRPDALVPELVERARTARFIYLVGESPMHLWSVMKNSPLWDAISQAWHDGATIAGSSAGARVIGDPMVDPRGGAFTVGLGLLANVAVLPHNNELSSERVRRTLAMAPEGLPIVAIDDATAAIRSPDGTWSASGAGEVTVHLDGAEAGLDALP